MSVNGEAMPDGGVVEEKRAAAGKPISAVFRPAKRARNYQLGVSWWSYPIHTMVWLLFVGIVMLIVRQAYEAGPMGVSIADIVMWDFALYVIFFMASSSIRDKRLPGWKKFNFYFSFGSACVLKAIWISAFLTLAAHFLGHSYHPALVNFSHGSVDMIIGGYWGDDMGFFTYMVFWFFIYWGFAGRGKEHE